MDFSLNKGQKYQAYLLLVLANLILWSTVITGMLKGFDPVISWIYSNPLTIMFPVIMLIGLIPVYSRADDIAVQRIKQMGFSGLVIGIPSVVISIYSFTVADPVFPQNAIFWLAKAFSSVSFFTIITAIYFNGQGK